MSDSNPYWKEETSPDGRIKVEYAITEGRMSHEIFSPRITDLHSGRVLLDMLDSNMWDGSVRWLDNGDFDLTIRNYGDDRGRCLPVRVYREDDTFALGNPPLERERIDTLRRRIEEVYWTWK
jgi:hypothetical protein